MPNKLSCLAIIPARSGSKRLPRKNFLNFKGKPLVEWTIKSSCESGIFNKIILSSDDLSAKSLANSYQICFSERNLNLASDKSSLVEVCENIIKKELEIGNNYDLIFCLYATSP